MIEDLPAIREEMSKHWQTASLDLIKRGFRPEAVFETMFTVGLAGFIEIHGKELATERLSSIAQKLADQARQEAEAVAEAAQSTKN
jgi:hypothetical protein